MLKPKIGLAVVYHPYEEGAEEAPDLFSKTEKMLCHQGLDVVPADNPVHDAQTAIEAGKKFREQNVDLLCLPLATWSSDYVVLDMLEQVDVPVVTWAFPGVNTGSLCGCQQIDCVLKEINKEYKFVYGDAPSALREIRAYSRAVALKNALRTARFGLVGYRVPGMTEVTFDEYALKSVFGPRIVHIGIDELKEERDRVPEEMAREKWKEVCGKARSVASSEDDCLSSIKAYFALKNFVERDGLSGLAVECYPNLMGQVCLPFSILSEEGIAGSCEGDVNSLVAMYMLHELSGMPVHNTDLLAVYEEDDSILLSHCGSGGFSVAEKPEEVVLAPVRLARKGVCVLYPSKPGKVTMVNLVGRKDTYRMCVIAGEAVSTGMAFPGNPVRVKIPIGTGELLNIVARFGFGHHWMIGYGDARKELTELGRLVGIQTVSIPETGC
ncbi:MAG: hypothetical protein JTT11_10580 [Candidatus Brockarchaeota archaeon]|nr:hypothetical protein [Candidatus Brockarchaeota archaeon]